VADRNFSTHVIRFNSYKMSEIEAANLQQEDDLTDIDKSKKMTLI